MKIQTQPKSHLKPIIILAGMIVIAFVGWLYYTHHYQRWPFLPHGETISPSNTVDYSKPSDEQAKSGTAVKEQVAEQAKSGATSVSSTSAAPDTITMDITSANKTSDTLMVRTLIQKVTSTGTCTLSMVGPNGGTYSASAGVQAMASTSTCQGFNAPLSGLAPGVWKITINFKDGSDTATATKEVTL